MVSSLNGESFYSEFLFDESLSSLCAYIGDVGLLLALLYYRYAYTQQELPQSRYFYLLVHGENAKLYQATVHNLIIK